MTTKTNKELNATLKTLMASRSAINRKIESIEGSLTYRQNKIARERCAAKGFRRISPTSVRPGMHVVLGGQNIEVLSTCESTRSGYPSRRFFLGNGKTICVHEHKLVRVAL